MSNSKIQSNEMPMTETTRSKQTAIQDNAPAEQAGGSHSTEEPKKFSYEYYQNKEDLTWEADTKQLQNLAWLLRMKAHEANERSDFAKISARRVTVFASIVASVAAIVVLCGWSVTFINIAIRKDFEIPENMWQFGVVTTAAAIMLAGLSTLLFSVAKHHYWRVDQFSDEHDSTRRIEAAVRLALSSGITDNENIKNTFMKFGEKLLERSTKSPETDASPDLSIVPEIVKKIQDLIEAISKAKRSGAGTET